MSKHKSRSQALSTRNPSSLYAGKKNTTGAPRKSQSPSGIIKTAARDILPSTPQMKAVLPTVLSVGAVVLGAVGIYALWKNRDKVEAFMGEHDIELPTFIKNGVSKFSRHDDQVSAH